MRRSAAILLTRTRADRIQVYLVERNPKLRFFGGYWAFPGGVVDEVDGLEEDGDDGAALERCAIRELFEETGLLLPPLDGRIPLEQRASLRASLVDQETDARAWLPHVQAADAARADLRLITTITTPEFSSVRHTTPFFQVELPEGQEPHIEPGELMQGRFWDVDELLRTWREGRISIVTPVLYLLEILARTDLEGFLSQAREMGEKLDGGQLHRAYFTPAAMLAPLSTPTLPPATTTNCVLVGNRTIYIVDPATPDVRDRERLFETLDRWILEGKTLAGVLLTHHHQDHVGAVVVTAERYGLKVYAHPETFLRVQLEGCTGVPIEHGHTFQLGTAPDGSSNWTLEAFLTPGHAHGHLVFIDSRYRTAIVGDLVSTLSTIVIDPPEGHMATYLKSLQAILDQDIGVLLPAHGVGARVGSDVLRYHLKRRAQREEKLLRVLASSPGSVKQLLPVVYDDAPANVLPYAERSLLAGLQKLEEDGHAVLDEQVWVRV